MRRPAGRWRGRSSVPSASSSTERNLGRSGGRRCPTLRGISWSAACTRASTTSCSDRRRKGRRFTARAVEGVRVKAGEEARADLRMIEGRRMHGTAVDVETGKPLVGVPIFCYSPSHPRSGAACEGDYTDDQGRFEHSSRPGPAFVYIDASTASSAASPDTTLIVPDDRDPDPVVLKRGMIRPTKDPGIESARRDARSGSG